MKAKILRECLGLISKLVIIHFGDYGTAVARTNKVNTNAFDASGIFRDVYIKILCILCRLRDCGSWSDLMRYFSRRVF